MIAGVAVLVIASVVMASVVMAYGNYIQSN
jgi:hypothetical protein